MGCVYALSVKGTNNYRYIGKTINSADQRLKGHIKSAKLGREKRPVNDWIIKYGPNNISTSVLDEADTEDELFALEMWWISIFKKYNISLLNLTDGGPGCAGWTVDGQFRKKISTIVKGRKHSEETKEKIRQKSKLHRHTDESKLKMKKAWTTERKIIASERMKILRPTLMYDEARRQAQSVRTYQANHLRWHESRDIIKEDCILCNPSNTTTD